MHSASLETFVARVRQSRRLGYADLRRLKRDVLPEGVTSRADAEALFSTDAALEHADRTWPDYLADVMTDYLFAGKDGQCLEAEPAEWLVSQLAKCRPVTARQVGRTVLRRATEADPCLREFLKGTRQRVHALEWPPPQPQPLLPEPG